MDKKDELIEKLKELIACYKLYANYSSPYMEHIESEVSALETEIKQEQIESQCHSIYKKVKEAWTNETDGEPEPGEVLTDKGIYDEDNS